jgi:hypothetical protein
MPKKHSFSSEIAIHLHFPEGYQKRHLFAFPRLSVCLDCGLVQFKLSGAQVERLQGHTSSATLESGAA